MRRDPHSFAMASLRESWIAWRNARLTDPAFHRWAGRFWPTRATARRRAAKLFDIVAGFTYSQVAFALVEAQLLPFLRGAPRTLAEIAGHADLPHAGAERLLKAAAVLGLVEPVGGRFALGADGAALIGSAGLVEMIAHHRLLYADLAEPLALLRAGRGSLARYWAYGSPDASAAATYSRLMAATQPAIAAAVLDAVDLECRRLLDVGGGVGVFAAAACDRVPGLSATVFDLAPVVAEIDDPSVGRVAGDFTRDALPGGHDLISLVRVLHDHDDAVVAALLARAFAALPPGGTLLIAEPMAGTAGAELVGDVYFGLYLYAMGSGRPRSASELRRFAAAAGFVDVREYPTAIPLVVRTLTAHKPKAS